MQEAREPNDIYMAKEFPGTADTEGERLLGEGKALQKIQTEFTTAIAVQRPRDIDKIQKAVLREAEFAGEDFFYSWTVKGKKGPQTIQGGSIGLAMSVAREWTNCAVDVQVDPGRTYDIFTACFIDIEKGFTVKRAFKQKRGLAPGKYDADRWEDMEFQKAQSKAIRNVVLSGVPRWLVNQAIEKAKDAELNKITKEGIDAASTRAIKFFEKYGITEEQIITKMGKPKNEWINEDILVLRGHASEIKDGQVSARELFPIDENAEQPKNETSPKPDPDDVFIDSFKNLRSKESVLKFEDENRDALQNASDKVQVRWDAKFKQQVGYIYYKPQKPATAQEKKTDDDTIPCPINADIQTSVEYCRDSCAQADKCDLYQGWKYNNEE